MAVSVAAALVACDLASAPPTLTAPVAPQQQQQQQQQSLHQPPPDAFEARQLDEYRKLHACLSRPDWRSDLEARRKYQAPPLCAA
jgi:hypothetical protein